MGLDRSGGQRMGEVGVNGGVKHPRSPGIKRFFWGGGGNGVSHPKRQTRTMGGGGMAFHLGIRTVTAEGGGPDLAQMDRMDAFCTCLAKWERHELTDIDGGKKGDMGTARIERGVRALVVHTLCVKVVVVAHEGTGAYSPCPLPVLMRDCGTMQCPGINLLVAFHVIMQRHHGAQLL